MMMTILESKSCQKECKKMRDADLPIIDSKKSQYCTTCLLPMQYQKKIDGKFVWQCFRCGKKYFVFTEDGKTIIEETWGPPR